jgi:hypothetical protein
MSAPNPSPKKLRPFAPLVSRTNRQRSISPPPDIDIGVNSTPLPASSGMFLLVRNVLPLDKPGFGKPVELVKAAIAELSESEIGKELAEITLDVIQGGRPQDQHCASAYIDLAQEIKALDTVPRPDLLTDWMNALAQSRPSWEIVWAPQKKGKDRRMIVRFRVADSKEKVPENAPDKIRSFLESRGHKTTGGYVSFNGLVDITFADTESVDTILASSYYHVPALSKEGMHVSPPKFIPINYPFELCIGGLNEYEGLHEIIEKWLYHVYTRVDDAGTKTSRVFDTRISSDRDHFIFTMDSWDSTILVLKDTDAFHTYFANSPLLTDPKLVFEMNSGRFVRKSVNTAINAGAGLVNETITEVKRDLMDFRKEQNENNSLVQRQFVTVNANQDNQTNALAMMGNNVHQLNLSLLAGRDEKAIEYRISAIDNGIMFEMQGLRSTDDPTEKAVFKDNITKLQKDRREQASLLMKASETTLMLIGPAPGSVFAHVQPAPTNAVTATVTEIPVPDISDAPSTPVRPIDSSLLRTASSTPQLPAQLSPDRTPARNLFTTDSHTSSSSQSLHLTPVVPSYDLSSVTTPTPAPRVSAAAKRNRLSNLLETNAKRLKPHERTHGQVTRSESRNTMLTHADDGDETHDLFNEDSVVMVCNPDCHDSTVLLTSPADQGRSFESGSRPLIAISCLPSAVPVKRACDQPGLVLTSNLLSSKLCYQRRPKSIPNIIVWAIIAIMLFCLISSASAVPSAAGSLSFYALNANGFVHPTKIDATNRAISHRNPDVVVITETKTNSARSSKMSYDNYQFFDERGVPVVGHHLYKWGVVLGIKKGITVSQRVPVSHPALIGRLIAVDIVIALDSGSGFVHRIIAAYAPWDVADTDNTSSYWTEATKICLTAPNSWTLLGDLNATVTQAERKTGGNDARSHYNNFLRLSKGHDHWSDYPDRSRFTDWTCKPRLATDGGSIIDRIVSSAGCFLDSEIYVADGRTDFVPMTDHRAVIGRIILRPPDRIAGRCVHNVTTPVLNNPRIKFPDYKDKHLFQSFRDQTDVKCRSLGLHDRTVTDDLSFISLYTELTNVINDTAADVFGRIKRRKRNVDKLITNSKIQQLQGRSRALGGALRLINEPIYRASHAAKHIHLQCSLEYSLNTCSHLSLRSFVLAKRKAVNKDLYRERSDEVYARAKKYDSFRITQALAGGSTKRLVHSAEFVPLPMSINTTDGSGKLLSDPEQVKAETRLYWERLYARQPIAPMDKPWLETESVIQVKQRVIANPFEWPRKATLKDFRALIRRGNARPSPGPDGMEKWCVKSLSDFALAPVLELHNYMTLNSCFPGDTKDMYLTMFHKRGLRTDLNNWRGLMMSNFIANSPMTWLNYLLTPFIAANSILPDTQVATQQGVQTRDLTSFLSGLLTWSNRHKTTVYALKRDQMKGFDYLAPEGFYDAVTAYGLPPSIIDIDKAAQTNTKVFIRTAHGITEPITVSGVAKQGGPISPLKSTLTTSMGHRYLDDVANSTAGSLNISTLAHDRLDPHLPNDYISLPIRMIEATDDSILFAESLPALQSFCLLEERFQFAYGWLTNWNKTTAYILSPEGIQPETVSFPSITVEPYVSPLTVTYHDVPLVCNELEFLRVKIDDPAHRYHELRDFIDAFTFPKFVGPTPLTLLRKIAMQSIASRARALLTFQPITDADALKLDRFIASKVHAISGFPWIYNTEISTLPVSLHGFEFPSIRRINASIAVDGLARDLNHHIPAYRNMALITLADWTCHINDCVNPLVQPGITKDFSRRIKYHTVPAAWIIAQKIMGSMNPPLLLCSTDHSHILNGDVSISHCVKLLKTLSSPPPSGTAVYSLRSAGFKLVSQLGRWVSLNHTLLFKPFPVPDRLPTLKKPSTAFISNWNKISDAFRNSSINTFYFGSSDLLIPRVQRRDEAESYISALAATCKFPPSLLAHMNTTWASDGSMIPAASTISDHKSVTAAVSGPSSLILRVVHRNASILQGEQMGIVSALVLADKPPQIYTDHLNSTRLIDDSQTVVNQDNRLRSMNGRSYYRWILDLASRKSATITYTKAHTSDTSLRSSLNREADLLASSAQKNIQNIPVAPVPTFYMNPYTFHRELDGWIESNTRYLVDHYLAKQTADMLALLPKHRMTTWLYDTNPPPPWIYTKASSAYTALVQLYARSGQLPTAEGMYQKKASSSSICRFGCASTENPHHIFSTCVRFSDLRNNELASINTSIKRRLDEADISLPDQTLILELAKSLFSDSDTVWPLNSTAFFLGQIPKIGPMLPMSSVPNHVTHSRLAHNISSDLHLSSVRLTSRIFGSLQKEISRRHAAIYGNRR